MRQLFNLNLKIDDYLAVLGVDALADSVDLLVHFSTVVITLLTSTSNSEGHTARMPGTDTGHLSQTLMCLPGKFLRVPTGSYT